MGLLDRLGLTRQRFDALSGVIDLGIASPWQEGNLSAIVPGDIFGADIAANMPMTRTEAMTIPAVAKLRNLLVSTIMRFPLVALDSKVDTLTLAQPPFLYRTNLGVAPQDRMAWTIDDCLFYGKSLWAVERGAENVILNAAWVPQSRWTVTNGKILIDEQPVDESEILLFNPPFEGLLALASRTLRGAKSIEDAWVSRAKNPIPLIELKVEEDAELTQEEVDAWVASWAAKHASGKPAVGATPPGVTLIDHGEVDAQLFVEARNAIRADIGAFGNVRASMLDGTTGIDSLTYSTTEGEKNSFYEFDLPLWTIPIEARLSQDDVVPRGQRIRFDMYDAYHLPTPTGTATED